MDSLTLFLSLVFLITVAGWGFLYYQEHHKKP
jgi:hypothetical protein